MKFIKGLLSFFGFLTGTNTSNSLASKLEVKNRYEVKASNAPTQTINEDLTSLEEHTYVQPLVYPIALRSSADKNIGGIEKIERNDKGVLEDFFFDHLSFPLKVNIQNDVRINLPKGKLTPDLVYIDKHKLIFIAIEIDEPYSIDLSGNFIPTHVLGSDDQRNKNLLDSGWHVLRFAEKQVAKSPKECEKCIIDFIESVESKSLETLSCWSIQEAIKMIEVKFRNTYLPFEFQGLIKRNNSYSYRHFETDTIRGITTKKDGKSLVVIQLQHNKKIMENGNGQYSLLSCYISETEFWNRVDELKISVHLKKYKRDHPFCRYEIYMAGMAFEGYGQIADSNFRLLDSKNFRLTIPDPRIKLKGRMLNKEQIDILKKFGYDVDSNGFLTQ